MGLIVSAGKGRMKGSGQVLFPQFVPQRLYLSSLLERGYRTAEFMLGPLYFVRHIRCLRAWEGGYHSAECSL